MHVAAAALLLPAATAALSVGGVGAHLCCSQPPLPRAHTFAQFDLADDDDLSQRMPIDTDAIDRERMMDDYKTASRAELAEYLPPWASEMMLDEEANEEYETDQASRRAAYLNSKRVKGRSWDEIDMEESDGAGMAEFTPEELAEDYSLPLETVLAFTLSLGVDPKRLIVNAPVKGVCSPQQLAELLAFLGCTDPIAAREELCESTLEELADGTPLSPDDFLVLCQQNEITALLGIETRIKADDVDLLLDAAEREIAFLGERPRLEED